MMLDFDSAYTEKDISELLKSLDHTQQTGTLTWAEFRKTFGMAKEGKYPYTYKILLPIFGDQFP